MSLNLVEIFKDTREKSNDIYKSVTEQLLRDTKVYKYPSLLNIEGKKKSTFQHLSLIDNDTITTAYRFINTYQKVAVLNFADAIQPGGLVFEGAKTQEENICRRTNLYESLLNSDEYYRINKEVEQSDILEGIYSDTIIYSKGVLVIKDSNYNDCVPKKIDVITCPSPSIYDKCTDINQVYRNRIRGIVKSAVFNDIECIVLGAWGCGAFHQDPKDISKAFLDVLSEYKYFKEVAFAIPKGNNYRVFMSTFMNKGLYMDRSSLLKEGTVVEHFKRETLVDEEIDSMMFRYQIIGISLDTTTNEDVVVYKALYTNEDGKYLMFTRPVDEFLSKVDKVKYPNIEREYRFQECKIIT